FHLSADSILRSQRQESAFVERTAANRFLAVPKRYRRPDHCLCVCAAPLNQEGLTDRRAALIVDFLIVLAKRRDKPYRSGRSPDWIKVKNPDAPAATRSVVSQWQRRG